MKWCGNRTHSNRLFVCRVQKPFDNDKEKGAGEKTRRIANGSRRIATILLSILPIFRYFSSNVCDVCFPNKPYILLVSTPFVLSTSVTSFSVQSSRVCRIHFHINYALFKVAMTADLPVIAFLVKVISIFLIYIEPDINAMKKRGGEGGAKTSYSKN